MKKRILTYLFLIIVFSALYFYFTRQIWLDKLSENLVRKDIVKKSDLLICAGGWFDRERIKYCLDFINNGYVQKILFLGDKIKIYEYKESWASLGKKTALKYGCKEENILIDASPSSTYEEALASKKIMDEKKFSSAIIVTAPFHLYRTKKIFLKVFNSPKYKLYFTYSPADAYFIHSWWIDEYSTVTLFNEYVKIMWYKYKYKM